VYSTAANSNMSNTNTIASEWWSHIRPLHWAQVQSQAIMAKLIEAWARPRTEILRLRPQPLGDQDPHFISLFHVSVRLQSKGARCIPTRRAKRQLTPCCPLQRYLHGVRQNGSRQLPGVRPLSTTWPGSRRR